MMKIFVSGIRLKVANSAKFQSSFENMHVRKMPSPKLQAAVVIFLKQCRSWKVTERLDTYQPEVTAHLKFLWSLLRVWIPIFEVLNFTSGNFLKLKYLDIYRVLLISSFNVNEKLDIYTKRMCDAVNTTLSWQVKR